jgi:hypothetical protein
LGSGPNLVKRRRARAKAAWAPGSLGGRVPGRGGRIPRRPSAELTNLSTLTTFAGVSRVGGGVPSGTIKQGPLQIWVGGGLARLASPGWPVSQLARLWRPIARAKHPREVPVSQFLSRSRSCPRVVPVSRRPPGPNTRARCQFPSSSHVPGVAPGWCPFPTVNVFLLLRAGAAQAPEEE